MSACGLKFVTLQGCDGTTRIASVRANAARTTRAEAVPMLLATVRFQIAYSQRVQVGWKFTVDGQTWDVFEVQDVEAWGQSFIDARLVSLDLHCAVPVTIRAPNAA